MPAGVERAGIEDAQALHPVVIDVEHAHEQVVIGEPHVTGVAPGRHAQVDPRRQRRRGALVAHQPGERPEVGVAKVVMPSARR
jgi:hypothetical protein